MDCGGEGQLRRSGPYGFYAENSVAGSQSQREWDSCEEPALPGLPSPCPMGRAVETFLFGKEFVVEAVYSLASPKSFSVGN